MNMARRRTALAGVGLLLVGTTTACGAVSDLIPQKNDFAARTAKEIFGAAKQDITSLEAVHVSGSIRQDGASGTINLSVSRSGECRGSVAFDGIHFDLLVAEKRHFFRPDEAFFRRIGQSPADAQLSVTKVGDRWVEDGKRHVGEVCDFQELFDMSDQGHQSLRKALPGKVTVSGPVDLMGIEAMLLSSTGAKGDYNMYVAVDEPHHVVQLTAVGTKKADGSLTYTEYDIPVDTDVPAPDQIFGSQIR